MYTIKIIIIIYYEVIAENQRHFLANLWTW